jgi:hypothetical protein
MTGHPYRRQALRTLTLLVLALGVFVVRAI